MLRSLNNFQNGTTFPYTASASGGMTRSAMGGMGCGRMDDGELPDEARPPDGSDGISDELPGDRKDNPAQRPESGQLTDADHANGRVDDGIRRTKARRRPRRRSMRTLSTISQRSTALFLPNRIRRRNQRGDHHQPCGLRQGVQTTLQERRRTGPVP